jgi:hypothetical protein
MVFMQEVVWKRVGYDFCKKFKLQFFCVNILVVGSFVFPMQILVTINFCSKILITIKFLAPNFSYD